MSVNINDSAYSTLQPYAILASSGITTVDTTTVTNGVYGSSPTASYTGNIEGTVDNANAGTAQTQLTALKGAINTRTSTLTPSPLGTITTTTTLNKNTNYNSVSNITFEGVAIVLDAENDSNAQFFITAGSSITFHNVPSITLINGALNCNIFWLAGSAITFTGTTPTSIPGIFIAGSAITFATASQINGRLYAETENVTFSGTSSVDAACDQIIVCYLKGTLILTNEGFVPIEKIKARHQVVTKGKISKNQFVNKGANPKLEPVTCLRKFNVFHLNTKSRPICVSKDAFGKNSPFKDLYVSPGHRFLIDGKMVNASELVNGKTIWQDTTCEEVVYYHLECEEHSAIIANGVLTESYLRMNNKEIAGSSNCRTLPKKRNLKQLSLGH